MPAPFPERGFLLGRLSNAGLTARDPPSDSEARGPGNPSPLQSSASGLNPQLQRVQSPVHAWPRVALRGSRTAASTRMRHCGRPEEGRAREAPGQRRGDCVVGGGAHGDANHASRSFERSRTWLHGGHRGLSAAASRSASYVGAAVMGMVRAAMLTLGGCRDVSGGHPHRWAVSLPPSAHETSPPWPPRLCNRRQPFRERGTFCSRLFGGRSHSSQFGSKLSDAFREVGPLSFSVVLMRFGVPPLLDGQPENAFQLGTKGRERGGDVVRFCRFRYYAGFSSNPKASIAVVASCSMAGSSGPCASKTRKSSAGSIAKPPSSVLCADNPPILDGAPNVDFARSGLFRRFPKAQSDHRVPSPARPCRGMKMGGGG